MSDMPVGMALGLSVGMLLFLPEGTDVTLPQEPVSLCDIYENVAEQLSDPIAQTGINGDMTIHDDDGNAICTISHEGDELVVQRMPGF